MEARAWIAVRVAPFAVVAIGVGCNQLIGLDAGKPAPQGTGGSGGSASHTTVSTGGAATGTSSTTTSTGGAGETSTGASGSGATSTGAGGANCNDGKEDGDETDVDCGGTTCPKCAAGKACMVNGDCTSGLCIGMKCQPTCTDGVQDGDETDVDCGGSKCAACAFGKSCLVASDCAGTFCNTTTNKCDALTLATGPLYARRISVDAASVYWVAIAGGTFQILEVPLGGGSITTLVPDADYTPGIAVDASYVYWTGLSQHAVMKVPLGGGTPIQIYADPNTTATAVAVDASYVYWTLTTGGVMRAPVGGGAATMLYSGQVEASDLRVDSTNVYWITHQSGSPCTVMMGSLSGGGGTGVQLASAPDPCNYERLATNSVYVFWTDWDASTLSEASTNGVLKPTVLASMPSMQFPSGVAVDPNFVYWSSDDGTVRKLPLGGGPSTVLASGQNTPGDIAVDASFVYWTNFGDGTVKKIHK